MRVAAVACLLLAGCEGGTGYRTTFERDEDRHASLNPPGRYQMLPAPDVRVYVLDTGDGSIRICGPLGAAGEQQPMGCGSAATQ